MILSLFLATVVAGGEITATPNEPTEYIKVEMLGNLLAIRPWEQVSDLFPAPNDALLVNDYLFELEINRAMFDESRKLNERRVILNGTMKRREEDADPKRHRWIVKVKKIQVAPNESADYNKIEILGTLKALRPRFLVEEPFSGYTTVFLNRDDNPQGAWFELEMNKALFDESRNLNGRKVIVKGALEQREDADPKPILKVKDIQVAHEDHRCQLNKE